MSDGTLRPRIWHPARDAYHCAFRLLRLLTAADTNSLELQRLRALDLLLLFPPFLHRMAMTQDLRRRFKDLEIPKADDIFVRLPSPAVVLDDLQFYQTAAISHLVARGILQQKKLASFNIAQLNVKAIPADLQLNVDTRNVREAALIEFLVTQLAPIPLSGTEGLLRRLGLSPKQVPI
ncbi:ABC-three component system middle component 5 [uncultured Reyranella sp.]|uniref:ABC-three component system middle component 5 n=1 Tax=uncultured Reyranella sp. TaxID=735512 RepID=UPI00338DE505